MKNGSKKEKKTNHRVHREMIVLKKKKHREQKEIKPLRSQWLKKNGV
jgi:hypothetical protein